MGTSRRSSNTETDRTCLLHRGVIGATTVTRGPGRTSARLARAANGAAVASRPPGSRARLGSPRSRCGGPLVRTPGRVMMGMQRTSVRLRVTIPYDKPRVRPSTSGRAPDPCGGSTSPQGRPDPFTGTGTSRGRATAMAGASPNLDDEPPLNQSRQTIPKAGRQSLQHLDNRRAEPLRAHLGADRRGHRNQNGASIGRCPRCGRRPRRL